MKSTLPATSGDPSGDHITVQQINKSDLEVGAKIGKGFFGIVYKGIYHSPSGPKQVAIKRIEKTGDADQLEIFEREQQLCMKAQVNDVVRFYGTHVGTKHIYMVFELMDCDLQAFLRGDPLTWKTRLEIALDIARATKYLHAHNLIHRDIKSENVLVRKRKGGVTAKLADLGLSRVVDGNTMTLARGTTFWMAPEVIFSGHYDISADIFSLGMTFTELATLKVPDPDWLPRTQDFLLDEDKLPVALPEDTPDVLMRAIRAACCRAAEERPTADEIVAWIEEALAGM